MDEFVPCSSTRAELATIKILQILDGEENFTSTSFYACFKKSNRLKFLFEELPTVEHVKLRRPDLYLNWHCPICTQEKETFSHIWNCPSKFRFYDKLYLIRKRISSFDSHIPLLHVIYHMTLFGHRQNLILLI
jgi:hypothetical protein